MIADKILIIWPLQPHFLAYTASIPTMLNNFQVPMCAKPLHASRHLSLPRLPSCPFFGLANSHLGNTSTCKSKALLCAAILRFIKMVLDSSSAPLDSEILESKYFSFPQPNDYDSTWHIGREKNDLWCYYPSQQGQVHALNSDILSLFQSKSTNIAWYHLYVE